jgi:drug/metabolite transporter (DMT)-like permease
VTDEPGTAERRSPLRIFDAHPRSAAVGAAVGLSLTAVLFALSETSPTTATFFRCLYALPLLWWLTHLEDRSLGPRPWRVRRWALLAGVFFAADLILFHHSILLMGAGLATVLTNLQVVVVLIAAWIIWGERPSSAQLVGIPIALAGIVLISGALGGDAYGDDPLLGSLLATASAVAYAGYLLFLRKGRDRDRAAGPILDSTLSCAIAALLAGILMADFEPLPTLPGHVWLLLMALTAQVGGGVMLAVALPRLPAATTSLILLVQPMLAIIFAGIILAEAPSAGQLVGVALVVVGVVLGSSTRRRRTHAEDTGPQPEPSST